MKICEAISQINSLKPNTYSDKQKIYWLNQLESMVKRLVIDTHEGGDQIAFDGFNENTSVETQLFMPSPFDMAYIYWLEAQIHYANEDIDMYNSAIMMFNATFSEYKADYKRNHATKGTGRFRF
jgi:hypothetical protein